MSWLQHVTGWVLDVDGCLVRTDRAGGAGGVALTGAIDFVTELERAGHQVLVCTNASELPPAAYADHLRELGFPITDEQFVTAGSAAADHVAAHHPGARVIALGGEGTSQPLVDRGLTLITDGNLDGCAAVIVGAAPAYHRDELNAACLAVEAGAVLYVTQNSAWFHGGRKRTIAVSALIAAAITWATGVEPRVAGKPSEVLAEALLERLGKPAPETAVVGDAIAEIRLARVMGAHSVAVLSGALTTDDIDRSDVSLRPDLVIADVGALHRQLTTSHPYHLT